MKADFDFALSVLLPYESYIRGRVGGWGWRRGGGVSDLFSSLLIENDRRCLYPALLGETVWVDRVSHESHPGLEMMTILIFKTGCFNA